jgi:hypothetical protein
MSSSQFQPDSDFDDAPRIVLKDEHGRSLECYVENETQPGNILYLLLTPVNTPVLILLMEEDDEDEEDVSILEDSEEIDPIFADAKAVLSELNLTLYYTAYTLTVSGELPSIEDESILSLRLDSDEEDDEDFYGEDEESAAEKTEELQFLASFYSQDQKYSIYTPLTPMLFIATYDENGQTQLVSPEEADIQPILEELLFEEDD